MKFVAAARLRRAQESALAARPYALELARMLRSIMSRVDEPEHPLLAKREEKNILVIVLSGERGLAGAFNSNILRKANDFIRKQSGKKIVAMRTVAGRPQTGPSTRPPSRTMYVPAQFTRPREQ